MKVFRKSINNLLFLFYSFRVAFLKCTDFSCKLHKTDIKCFKNTIHLMHTASVIHISTTEIRFYFYFNTVIVIIGCTTWRVVAPNDTNTLYH